MGRHSKPAHNRKAKGVPRLPNGRLSRTEEAKKIERMLELNRYEKESREAMLPALQARTEKFGIKPKTAMDQYAGSVIGRLCLMGEQAGGINQRQMHAATAWLEERAAYQAAIASPPDARAFDMGRTPGRNNAEDPERDKRAIQRHKGARDALQAAQDALRLQSNLWAAMNIIVEQDKGAPHLVGDLREALNALARHYDRLGRKMGRVA